MVSLHVPLNDATRDMIDANALTRMQPKAILINTCRGEVVQEEALIDALRQGRILGAGLDTHKEPPDPTNPLLTLPNVTLTPHSAGPTFDTSGFTMATRIFSVANDQTHCGFPFPKCGTCSRGKPLQKQRKVQP